VKYSFKDQRLINALIIFIVLATGIIIGFFASPLLVGKAEAQVSRGLIKVTTQDLNRCDFNKTIVMANGGGLDAFICVKGGS
jgi:hypothetical protein